MRDWFESLAPRERLFVSVGAVVVVVAILWGLIWAPLARAHAERAEAVSAWQQSLAELGPLAARASAAPGSISRPASTATPVVIIDRTLRARGLDRSLKRSQPTTSNGIRVEFENVAFDELVLWLGELSSQHAMDVQAGTFSVAPRSPAGRVNATLTLERSP